MPSGPKHLRVAFYHYPLLALGPGKRVGIWLQGCLRKCPHCLSPNLWDPEIGSLTEINELYCKLSPFWKEPQKPEGITISGGEPLDQAEGLLPLLKKVRKHLSDDILLYTGYSLQEIQSNFSFILPFLAGLVAGPFKYDSPTDSIWKGSENQVFELLEPRHKQRYTRWLKARDREMQLIKKNGYYIIGIPHLQHSTTYSETFGASQTERNVSRETSENLPGLQ